MGWLTPVGDTRTARVRLVNDTYPGRDIAVGHSRDIPRGFLQSLFVGELLAPSRPLWIVSPWISDIELLDNSARQFSALNPNWPASMIRLSRIIETLLERGGKVRIVANDDPHNEDLRSRMASMLERYPSSLHFRQQSDLHAKGITGEGFALDGSMNLTHNGVYRNDEYLIFRTDPASVSQRRLELEHSWEADL